MEPVPQVSVARLEFPVRTNSRGEGAVKRGSSCWGGRRQILTPLPIPVLCEQCRLGLYNLKGGRAST
jgi:hypothetical protein